MSTWRPNRTTVPAPRRVDGVEGLVPRWEWLAGVPVDVAAAGAGLVPERESVEPVAPPVVRWPPDLMVGGAGDLPDELAGQGASHGGVQVRCSALLRLDAGEVLAVPAGRSAEVLPEPVDQQPEVDRVAGGPAVVVAGRVDRGAVRRTGP